MPNAQSHYIILPHVFFTSCPSCYSSTMNERFDPSGGYHIVINGSPIMIRTPEGKKLWRPVVYNPKLKTQLTVFAPTKRGRLKHKKQKNVPKETTTKQDGCHELELT